MDRKENLKVPAAVFCIKKKKPPHLRFFGGASIIKTDFSRKSECYRRKYYFAVMLPNRFV
jgi:hypothetical protein